MQRLTIVFLFVLVSTVSAPVALAVDQVDKFAGTFAGKVETETDKGLTKRKATVGIKKTDRGFTVDWETIVPKSKGRTKIKKYKIQFSQAKRKKLYAAGMRRNLFGKLVPLNPLEGDPYMWATIRGDTMYVYGMHVTEDGGYEFQINERRIEGDKLHVTFKRFRDGKQLKEIKAVLTRRK